MKSLEYIKSILDEKIRGYEQVLNNPENYDSRTFGYAKSEMEYVKKWYEEALNGKKDNKE